MSAEAQILAALMRQTELLTQILESLKQPRLGLHDGAGVYRVYCNRSHGCLWYTLDNDRQPVPIPQTALTGYLQALKFEQLERRNKPTFKLLLTIKGDRLYILESGHDSQFSKGALMAIASLTPEQLRQPLTLQPQAGNDDNVLFCRVYDATGERVAGTYDDNTNWREISKRAIANVTEANHEPS